MPHLEFAIHGNRKSRKIALTFDDGPNPYATGSILDILHRNNIKATFFVLGMRAKKYPTLLRKIHREGHLVGNHTFSHNSGDFTKSDKIIKRLLGFSARYLRPPFYDLSFCATAQVKDKIFITGDVDSKDYLSILPSQVIKNVTSAVKNGSIVDFHDGSEMDDDLEHRAKKTISALPKIIKILKSRGFVFVTVEELDLKYSYFSIQ